MNTPRRFPFGPARQPDTEIMKRASSIELRLWHSESRGVEGSIEIHCSIGNPFDDKYRTQEEVDGEQANALKFVRDVLRAFERRPDDGMAAAG